MSKPAAIQYTPVLTATWTDCPEDVKKEIQQLWLDVEFGNNDYYYWWELEDYENGLYPAINKYLDEKDIECCLIHYWW